MKNPKDSNSKTQSTSNMRKTTPRHIITKLLKNSKGNVRVNGPEVTMNGKDAFPLGVFQ